MNWRDRLGLSLMELLIALALLAAITGALATSTQFGVRLLDRTQSLQEDNAEIALRFRLRTWLGTATPPTRLARFPTDFVGSETGFTFTTLAPAPFAPDSAALRITVGASGADLAMQLDELNDQGEIIITHERVLATDASQVSISYYANDPETPGWRGSWADTSRLPSMVRITADPGSTPDWPEFTVKLALGQTNY